MKIYDYSYNVIEQDMELEITKEVLKMRNINYNNYDNFATLDNKFIVAKLLKSVNIITLNHS